MSDFQTISLLDYGAGNVRSLRNAIRALGYEVQDISTPEEIHEAKMIIFPGVGSFGQAMTSLFERGWLDALKAYIKADRPFFGICLGMQSLFEGSEESPGVAGLGIIPGMITRFDSSCGLKVTNYNKTQIVLFASVLFWIVLFQLRGCIAKFTTFSLHNCSKIFLAHRFLKSAGTAS